MMALGFPNTDKEIQQAILDAVHDKILVFAAAGNHANNHKIAFPARMSEVISVFSTDAGSRASKFNPPPQERSYNFAILGEGVDVDEGSSTAMDSSTETSPTAGGVYGTSVATAIAAGFAASLIDFSRQPDCRDSHQGRDFIEMRDQNNMRAILSSLSVPDKQYDCIVPWRLAETIPTDVGRAETRRRLHDLLNQSLDLI